MNAFLVGDLPWWHSRAMPNHHGKLDSLQDAILIAGIEGEWEEKPNNCWRLKCPDRSGMNWSATKGTIWFDGPDPGKSQLAARVEDALKGTKPAVLETGAKQHIFVVHGHDSASREQLELVLHKLGCSRSFSRTRMAVG